MTLYTIYNNSITLYTITQQHQMIKMLAVQNYRFPADGMKSISAALESVSV